MLRGLEGWHIVVIGVVVVALFGYRRMPEAARSLGRSMRIFKSEVQTMKHDGDAKDSGPAPATVPSDPVTGPLRVDPTTPPVDARPR